MVKQVLLFCFGLLPLMCAAQVVESRGVIVTTDSVKSTGTTYAIVIGISKYKEVIQLHYADRDAEVFADYLLNKSGMALDSGNVKLFVNENATLGNIGNALSDIMIKKLKKGDRVIFFFAGHGDYDANILKDQALLLLYGAPKQNYFQNIFTGDFISTADLNSRFIEPLANKGCDVLLFIDACHATGLDKTLSGGSTGGKITSMALQSMTSNVKIYSCESNQYSLESDKWGGGRGLFSYVLMEALYGMADVDNDKIVTLKELQRYLEDNIPKMAENKQYPIIKMENPQEALVKVNTDFLNLYKKREDKTLIPVAQVSVKRGIDPLESMITKSANDLYHECDSLINKQELDKAYETFLRLAKTDSNSDAIVQLKRNLSEALQQKAGTILTPLLKDISNWNGSNTGVIQAEKDLEKAAGLLGEKHIMYPALQARILFLKAQVLGIDNTATNDEAIDYLERSIRLEPNAPYTYFILARFYHKRNELEKAKLCFDKYVDLIPGSAWAYNNRGWVYYDLKRYGDAIDNYKKAIELKPDYEVAYNNLGNAYSMLKNYDEAIMNYNKVITLKPEYGVAYNNLGNIYCDLKKYDTAITYIKKAIELNPDNANSYNNLGRAYLYLNNYEEAVKNYSRSILLKPDNKVAYSNLASAYLFLNNYDSAAKCYQKLIVLQPDCLFCFYSLCTTYSLKKDTVNSLFYFEEALIRKYNNLQKIETDRDLDNIRVVPGFKSLLEKYFTKEELGKYPNLYILRNH